MLELIWISPSQAPWDHFVYRMVKMPDGSFKMRVLQVGVTLEEAEISTSSNAEGGDSKNSYGTFPSLVFQHLQGMIAGSDLTYSVLEKRVGGSGQDPFHIRGSCLSLDEALKTAKKFDLAVIDDVTLSRFLAAGLIAA